MINGNFIIDQITITVEEKLRARGYRLKLGARNEITNLTCKIIQGFILDDLPLDTYEKDLLMKNLLYKENHEAPDDTR